MSIFGQVWLWSVAAFLVGVLLTWVLLVRPAQSRSRALERRLQAAQAAASERQSMMNSAATRIAEAEPASRATDSGPVSATKRVQPVEDEPQPATSWLDRDSFGRQTPEPSPAGRDSLDEASSQSTRDVFGGRRSESDFAGPGRESFRSRASDPAAAGLEPDGFGEEASGSAGGPSDSGRSGGRESDATSARSGRGSVGEQAPGLSGRFNVGEPDSGYTANLSGPDGVGAFESDLAARLSGRGDYDEQGSAAGLSGGDSSDEQQSYSAAEWSGRGSLGEQVPDAAAGRGGLGEQAPEGFETGGFGDEASELTSAGDGRGGFGEVLDPALDQTARGGLDEPVSGPGSERLKQDRFGRAAESPALGVERNTFAEQGSDLASAGPDADPLGGRTSEAEPVQSDLERLDRTSLGGLDRTEAARHESDAEKTSIFASFQHSEPPQRTEPEPPRHEAGSLFAPASENERGSLPGSLFDPHAQPESEHSYGSDANAQPGLERGYGSHAAPEEEAPAYAFGEPETTEEPGKVTETTTILPKRQPRSTPPSSFEPPRPSMRSIERREPVADEGGRSGSLFEPTVRPNSAARGAHAAPEVAAPTPPPARAHLPEDTPPGPFGPGSAMPRPGGGRPSEEYAVKASVTALRYCTEDSPQFNRMVAEVWFRSVADAERVGFRSLSS